MSEGGGYVREEQVRRMIQDELGAGGEPTEGLPTAPPIADPTPVGIAGFALTTFLLSCVNARLLGEAGPGALTWLPLAFFYGGLVQFLAGIWEFRNNNLFGALVFSSFGGGFWPGLAFFFFFGKDLGLVQPNGQPVGPAIGFFLVGWTIFTIYLWIASAKVNLTVFITFIVFVVTLILLDIGFMTGTPGIVDAGGYAGILLAAFAWYISAAGLINHVFGRTVLPLGSPLGGS